MTVRPRLLAIDDEPDIGQLVVAVAARAGFEAKAVHDPQAIRDAIASWAPTHILLDLQMPLIDGIQLLREFGEGRVPARIVIVSGADKRVLAAARRLGNESGLDIAAVLQKPIRVPELRARLAELAAAGATLEVDALMDAMDQDRLYLEYQPTVRAADYEVVGVEALVRWNHPTRGPVLPGDFIPLAEDAGLIADMTDWIAQEAIRQCRRWKDGGFDLRVSINLSALSLTDLALPERLVAMCSLHHVDTRDIVIEITESAAMENQRSALDILTRLRLKGFTLSIDDFGIGYSSLKQLQRMPFSELKIDRSFLDDGLVAEDDVAIVRAILSLSHSLGLAVVAEGVEDRETADRLRKLGCDFLQGFYFGRSCEPAAIERMVSSARQHSRTSP